MVNWAVKGYPWGGTKPRYSSINTAGDDETFDNYTQSSLVHQHLFKVVGWTNFQGHWKISVALLMTIYRSIGQLALLVLAPHLAQSFPPWIDLLSPHKSVSHSEWLCKLYAQRGDLWGFLLWTVTYKKKVFCHGTLGWPLPTPAVSLATSMRVCFLDGWVPNIIASELISQMELLEGGRERRF